MAVDLKGELTRPFALILAALATLGWVLFVLSSWSAASVRKTQRLQILQLTEQSEKLNAELSRQLGAAGSLAELQTRIAQAREDLDRATQTRGDVQSELATAQRNLTSLRRDLSEVDRSIQTQTQKLTEVQTTASEAEPATPVVRPGRAASRRTVRGRKRVSRSFRVRSR
jgi:chromosome segregation ATPase